MNQETRDYLEEYFRERLEESDHTDVEFTTVIEVTDDETAYLWFEAVGDGEFSEQFYETLVDETLEGRRTSIADGAAAGMSLDNRITSIGFSFIPEEY